MAGTEVRGLPNVKRWFEAVGARPAVARGAAVGADLMSAAPPPTDEDKKRLFGLRDQDLKPPVDRKWGHSYFSRRK